MSALQISFNLLCNWANRTLARPKSLRFEKLELWPGPDESSLFPPGPLCAALHRWLVKNLSERASEGTGDRQGAAKRRSTVRLPFGACCFSARLLPQGAPRIWQALAPTQKPAAWTQVARRRAQLLHSSSCFSLSFAHQTSSARAPAALIRGRRARTANGHASNRWSACDKPQKLRFFGKSRAFEYKFRVSSTAVTELAE